MATDNELETARQLGHLSAAVAGVSDAVTRHADLVAHQMAEARAARSKLYETVESRAKDLQELERKMDLVCRKLTEYEPDLKRCRMFRYWGMVSVGLIAAGGALVGFMSGVSDWVTIKFTGGS